MLHLGKKAELEILKEAGISACDYAQYLLIWYF